MAWQFLKKCMANCSCPMRMVSLPTVPIGIFLTGGVMSSGTVSDMNCVDNNHSTLTANDKLSIGTSDHKVFPLKWIGSKSIPLMIGIYHHHSSFIFGSSDSTNISKAVMESEVCNVSHSNMIGVAGWSVWKRISFSDKLSHFPESSPSIIE